MFDLDRFWKVCQHEWLISGRSYLRFLGIILGIILAIAAFNIFNQHVYIEYTYLNIEDPLHGLMQTLFWMGLVISMCISASNIFHPLANKLSATNSLMLPASQFEKYLCRWIMMVPLCIVLYFVGFFVVEILRCLMLMYYVPHFPISYAFGFITMFGDSQAWDSLLALVTLQSFFVLGSALWPKRAAIYTFGSLFLLVIIFGWTAALILEMRFREGNLFIDNEINLTVLLSRIASACICLINYTLAYFRYREAEIINHW